MTAETPAAVEPTAIVYPETDGQPMGENTIQFQWIVTIQGNLEAQFGNDRDVFVAGDLFWYPVQGQSGIRIAPDVLVAFGRPKGHRSSYMQWVEGGIAPQVVFEVLSPGNTDEEMDSKFDFYDGYGVEEYYLYDPATNHLDGWMRSAGSLRPLARMNGWTSPRLGIHFDLSGPELVIYRRNGAVFLTQFELNERYEEECQRRKQAEQQAEQARQQAEQAHQQAEQAHRERDQAVEQLRKLAQQLRERGIDPDQIT